MHSLLLEYSVGGLSSAVSLPLLTSCENSNYYYYDYYTIHTYICILGFLGLHLFSSGASRAAVSWICDI